jgi:hypothetical protein
MRLIAVFVAVTMVTSCASMTQKFKAGTVANVGVFADQTIAMLSDADFGFSDDQAIYLRDFWDAEYSLEKAFMQHRNGAGNFFRGIVLYSLNLVLIVETKPSVQDQIEAYADYLGDFDDKLHTELEIKPDHYNQIIEEIRSTETLLDALRAAQPIINASGRFMNQILDDLQKSLEELAIDLEKRIDFRYRDVVHFQKVLEKEKYHILGAMEKLYWANDGDMEAYRALIESQAIMKKSIIPKGEPTEDDFIILGKYLYARLDGLDRIVQEIEPDWELYRASHQELDQAHIRGLDKISQARLITLVWTRAHQKMSSGVSTPAEWFDIKSLPKQLIEQGASSAF